jgi:hypothetical protein
MAAAFFEPDEGINASALVRGVVADVSLDAGYSLVTCTDECGETGSVITSCRIQ